MVVWTGRPDLQRLSKVAEDGGCRKGVQALNFPGSHHKASPDPLVGRRDGDEEQGYPGGYHSDC